MKRRIAVFTGSRAEYGLLSGVMRAIRDDATLELQVIAGAMHFAPEFGMTAAQIVADGFQIDAKVEMLLASDSRVGVVKSLGLGTIGMADALERLAPDLLVILGDRFEALAAAQAALIMGVPIAHIHGGEITEGAYDDAIRHAITKMAALHFVAAEPYRARVIQMGTPPGRVINVGAPGLDGLAEGRLMPLDEVSAQIGFAIRAPYFLATYHPATSADEDPEAGCRAMLAAMAGFAGHQMILTYPNADNGGRAIIRCLEAFTALHPGRAVAVASLGRERYRAVLAGAAAMVGNSSSGIIEAPAFRVPVVNIGGRQKGRLAAAGIRHAGVAQAEISAALGWAISATGRDAAQAAVNPYGQGKAAAAMLHILKTVRPGRDLPFHDLAVQDPAAQDLAAQDLASQDLGGRS